MSKKTEDNPRPSEVPPTTDREDSNKTVNKESTSVQKRVVYEIQYEEYLGEQIPYIVYDGIKRYPVNAVGRLFGYGPKDEFKLYRENEAFLAQFTISAVVGGKRKSTSVPCIDSTGLLIMTGKAPLGNLSLERRGTVIKIVQFMAESADMRLKGELVPKGQIIDNEDLERMGGSYGDHSFLTGMVTHIVRKIRKKDPHSCCPSEQEIYQEDFNDILGPGKIKTNWRKGLQDLDGKKLTVKKFFQGSNFLAGNVRKEENRNKVIKDIEEYCPQFKPDYMPSSKQLDPTKQSRLLLEGETI